ncbi:DHA2 family efflux MFS transporter permease subunit [Labrys monachus]|uniref:DHA2 family multidrug resistance protein n=1 Tax=Labrys monachus TaxID=217067 RepID=A0ABU0FAB0_9HYPH|nr:DHA2 family efflux MFS transporter permease subunit [Labrys monachus]MDQ0391476.1 DHA2 family multidrug resistance protein [Labrys monachus]
MAEDGGKSSFDLEQSAAGGHNPWLIAIVVSIATFMEVLDTTIANVALRYIAGSLAASQEESTWVVTSYLVANAVVLSISGWLARTLGRKRFYMICVAVFTISSLLCGFAWNLQSLLFFRVLQGLGGGGMAPCSQSILADSFPPEKRGQAFGVFGIAVVVAPVVGPTLGGWLTDTYSWHWCFLINGPVGILSLALVAYLISEPAKAEKERLERLKRGINFDFVGFLLIALGLGCLEVVLDKGQEDDWFGSSFILVFAVIAACSLIALVPWELSRREPIVEIRLLFRRQFGMCFVVMLGTGAILISTIQFMPQLLQESFGYTALLAGLTVSPGGLVTMAMMPVGGRLTGFIQPKYLIMFGAALIAYSMWHLTGLSPDINFSYAVWARVILAAGLPFIFIPITTASYDGVPPDKTDQASALINVARNQGGSFGVALAQTVLARREQFHQSRLSEHTIPSSTNYQAAMQHLTELFMAQGAGKAGATQEATAWIGQTIAAQATFLAYIDVFWVLALLAAVMIPAAMLIRPVKLGSGGGPMH